jgi:hypothetical protein
MFNPFSIFMRSRLYANLTPGERAFLRFVAVLAGGAFLAGVQAAAPLLTTLDPTSVPWASVGHTFLAAFALAVWLGIGKYRAAQGDPPLPEPPTLPSGGDQPVGPMVSPVVSSAPPASSLMTAPTVAPSSTAASATTAAG